LINHDFNIDQLKKIKGYSDSDQEAMLLNSNLFSNKDVGFGIETQSFLGWCGSLYLDLKEFSL